MINKSFKDYKLGNDILKAVDMLNFKSPTKVQCEVMPSALEKKDIVVKSQTGSGKTAAFAIPLCQMVDWDENKPQALVLTPTRELAIQVSEDFFNIGRFKRLKICPIFGKSPYRRQERELKQKAHVVVGTPGRVIDHIERGTFDTSQIKYFVIDEADEMLNMGFLEQVETIISNMPRDRMTMLFSATMPSDIKALCEKYMNDPIHVQIESKSTAADRIVQERYSVCEKDKMDLLRDITIVENPDSCIIFCNTKQKVDDVCRKLSRLGYSCDKIHGGMEQSDRLKVMNNFREGSFRYLVATDVAARGIDIDNITHVINYDIPQDRENYVHRIGRTARAGKTGKAITFAGSGENRFLNDIHDYIDKEISLMKAPRKDIVESLKQEFDEKMKKRPKVKEAKGAKLSREIVKLHINAGKKTKMRPVDIVGTLCNIDGMTADDIGIINVLDISTFVEILNNKGEMVFEKLQNKPIKGRIRRVSKADD